MLTIIYILPVVIILWLVYKMFTHKRFDTYTEWTLYKNGESKGVVYIDESDREYYTEPDEVRHYRE